MTHKPFTHSNHPALHYEPMLADSVRMDTYRRAIMAAVRPGDVVADLGTGLGVLAMMAAQAGASKVYAVDTRPGPLEIAKRLFEDNHLADKIECVLGDARTVEIDAQVDLIINELIGDFGTDENIVECVAAFADRHLKGGGRIVPEHLKTFLVPVQYADEFRGTWRVDNHGLDLRGALDYPCNSEAVMYGLTRPATLLAMPVMLENIHFDKNMTARDLQLDRTFEIHTAGILQGFLGYFSARLVDGIELTNYPRYPGCHWDDWHWPVEPPLQVDVGQSILARLDARVNMVAPGWSLDWELQTT